MEKRKTEKKQKKSLKLNNELGTFGVQDQGFIAERPWGGTLGGQNYFGGKVGLVNGPKALTRK